MQYYELKKRMFKRIIDIIRTSKETDLSSLVYDIETSFGIGKGSIMKRLESMEQTGFISIKGDTITNLLWKDEANKL